MRFCSLVKIFSILIWSNVSWAYMLTLDDMPKNEVVMATLEDFAPQAVTDATDYFDSDRFAAAHILVASAIDRYPLELTAQMIRYRQLVGSLLNFRISRPAMQRYFRPTPVDFDAMISEILNNNRLYMDREEDNPEQQPVNNQIYDNKIPKKRYAMIQTDEKEACSICMDEDRKFCQLKSCKHKFHLECIEKWYKIKKNCPLCRAKIDK